jgi:hypothetical protein
MAEPLDYESPPPGPFAIAQAFRAVLVVSAIVLGLLFVGLLAMTAL